MFDDVEVCAVTDALEPIAPAEADPLEDRLPRLPLLTVPASRIGRAMALKYLGAQKDVGANPDDVADYLHRTIGWKPAPHTLYRRILLRLAGKDRVPTGGYQLEPVVDIRTWGGPNHKQTRYFITPAGRYLLESETKELLGPCAPLSSSVVGLQHLTRLVAPDGEKLGLVVNTNVLLRWLVLHTLTQIGPAKAPDITSFAYSCAGQIGYVPQGKQVAENWPLDDAIRRAAKELMDPRRKLWGAVRKGAVFHLTETGSDLYQRWRPDLGEALQKALFMAETAHAELEPQGKRK